MQKATHKTSSGLGGSYNVAILPDQPADASTVEVVVIMSNDFNGMKFKAQRNELTPLFLIAPNGNPTAKHTTEEEYDEMLGVLPPIYFRNFNFDKVQSGFAVSEILRHNSKGIPVYTVYFQDETGQYWKSEAAVCEELGKYPRFPIEWHHYEHAFFAGFSKEGV